jgi:predicted Holliday junction resolvase-like endonuclease
LVGVLLVLLLATMHYKRRYDAMREELEDERSRQRSLSTVYGRISEQWFPLMDRYPYDSQGFRFLGSPVDGIQFEADRIVFCEFKANRSDLSTEQRRELLVCCFDQPPPDPPPDPPRDIPAEFD